LFNKYGYIVISILTVYTAKRHTYVILSPSPFVILSEVKNLMRSAQDKFREESLIRKPKCFVWLIKFSWIDSSAKLSSCRSSFRRHVSVLSPPKALISGQSMVFYVKFFTKSNQL